MPVETIECQIVQAQLGRYLTGDRFSHEALAELEDHIARCPICRQEVAVRKATLQSLLGATQAAPADALVQALREKAPSTKTATTQAVVEQMDRGSASSPTSKYGKPLLYGTGLAVVLIAMSYLGNNPTSLFGERASTTLSQPSAASTTAPVAVTPPVVITPQDAVPATAPALTEDEWTLLGLSEWMPYSASDTTLEPWEWMVLADELAGDGDIASSEAAPDESATLKDWELLGIADVIASPDASAVSPTAGTPKPRTSRPQPRKQRPRNTIRIYEPNE